MPTGLGITIPLTRGKTGYFAQSFTIGDALKTNLVNLLLTTKGERPFQPTFGCDIHNLVFDQMGDEYQSQVEQAIKNAVAQWMPFLDVTDINMILDVDHHSTSVTITFNLKTNVGITDAVTITF